MTVLKSLRQLMPQRMRLKQLQLIQLQLSRTRPIQSQVKTRSQVKKRRQVTPNGLVSCQRYI